MNLLTRRTDYAVKALLTIAKAQRPLPAGELAKELSMPKAFLRGILQTLAAKKILDSAKGPSGGFSLARPARRITLASVIKAFQGELSFNDCMFRKRICPDRAVCPLRKEILDIESAVISRFETITINSLMKKMQKRRPGH